MKCVLWNLHVFFRYFLMYSFNVKCDYNVAAAPVIPNEPLPQVNHTCSIDSSNPTLVPLSGQYSGAGNGQIKNVNHLFTLRSSREFRLFDNYAARFICLSQCIHKMIF